MDEKEPDISKEIAEIKQQLNTIMAHLGIGLTPRRSNKELDKIADMIAFDVGDEVRK